MNPVSGRIPGGRIVRLALFLGCAFVWSAGAAAATLNGVVFVVIDGDTVLFKPDHYAAASRAFLKIRLAGLDAPEADQPHGEAATGALSGWLLNKKVSVDTVAIDDYGRTVGRIRSGTLDINAELVRQGHAWASTWRSQPEYRELQAEAQRQRRGLWHADNPTPPWVWRRMQSGTTRSSASR